MDVFERLGLGRLIDSSLGKRDASLPLSTARCPTPLYIVHYPLMYLFYRYHGFPNVTCTMADVWPMAVVTFVGSILLATLFLYAYDKPVRRWLNKNSPRTSF